MAPFLIGSILIDAALLGILVHIFARHNATNDLFNRVGVVVGVTIGGLFIDIGLRDDLGGWVLLVHVALCAVLLTWWVGTNPVQTGLIVALFYGIKIAIHFALAYVLGGE